MLQWLLATLHLLALGCGLGAIAARGRNLADQPDGPAWQRSLRANNWWHLALCLWLLSGISMLVQQVQPVWVAGSLPPAALAKLLCCLLLFTQEWRSLSLLRQCRERLERGRLPADELRSRLCRASRRQLALLLLLLLLSTAWHSGLFNTH
ncbi:DUF2214 family protein [Aquitalea sp. LB_tupeE]|uniref:DUF2214 family protein n=1 Tax=Aquitalea sp. LB_tupeE TaxID=2748078 RepID=UPI0015BE2D4E|nr:DUF2214 family protein [Aquitalea sp. LB_tupeE]NWK77523.1 DUF2214 family protein [Aquitalea sp. LB_tupeE]